MERGKIYISYSWDDKGTIESEKISIKFKSRIISLLPPNKKKD